MSKEYSLLKIIKNKIGFSSIFILAVSIICIIIAMLLIKNVYIKIQLISISIIIFLFISIYSIINIFKIKYYFINGIETKAIIRDNLYIKLGRGYYPSFTESGKDLEENNGMYGYKNKWWGRYEYKKNGAIYEYKINGEMYKSSSNFVINGDTMFLKEGSMINILANPKNKNKAIIKDIYKK
jgi:hypothetical protein